MILTAMNRMRNVTLRSVIPFSVFRPFFVFGLSWAVLFKLFVPVIRYLAELFRGQLNKKDADQAMRLGHTGLPFYGRGVGMSDQDSLRFLRKMVGFQCICERLA